MILLLLAACAPEPECTIVYETIYVTDTASSDDTGDTADTGSSADTGDSFVLPYPDCSNSCYCWINEYEECQFEIGLDIHDLTWLNSYWEDPETCATMDDSRTDFYECLISAFDIDCSDHEALQSALLTAGDCY